ncbi:hypothetical protein [Tengunoibacter tsumagoiensis]|uniref:Uncharacterized protein n=1 Tax=Tengunoibacter tsumagoiensis TaxID=2014871 RepID=A0A402A9C8_9CHLR|nr:hypothetical protein [Tengunoibacter tsumagoiensis]GCE15750.1 hypothetical protein KTT_56090 [Tengunoibacter tsumagoiensis]
MMGAQQQRSEVARLLTQIRQEYESAQRGLTDLTSGCSRHAFIASKMKNMGKLHHQLQAIVGDSAIALVADQLYHCSQDE